MSTAQSPVVTQSAYLTLHYRLASMDGTDIVSTFSGTHFVSPRAYRAEIGYVF